METSVAFVVCQVKEADPPAWMLLGLTEIEAVGAGDGGGGGGGAGATFFLQAPKIMMAPRVIAVANFMTKCRFILSSSYGSTPSRIRVKTWNHQHRDGYRCCKVATH